VPCCDICDPTLFNKTRPGKPPIVRRQTAIKHRVIDKMTRLKLEDWRDLIQQRDFPDSMFGSSAILKDETIEFLSSLGRITEREHLLSALVGQWKWEARYGGELFGLLSHEDVGVFVALPKRTWGTKRPAAKLDDQPTQPSIFMFMVTTQEEKYSQQQVASGLQATKHQRSGGESSSTSINQQLATRCVHEAGANFACDQLPQVSAAPLPFANTSQVLNPLRHQTRPSIPALGQFDFIFHNTPPGAAPS
jgi:hypothetical protein